jgi:enoyl-CoA hydratase/carnithine racemase
MDMSLIVKENQGNIALLTLNNGVANAISPELVDELSAILKEIKKEACGLLLCGGKKFFSMGFDLPALITLNRPEMTNFLSNFHDLILDLYTIPIPSAAVLEGHAAAGGNILAIACDFRYATTQPRKMGVNEVKLGLPVPSLADGILRQIAGDRAATRMLYGGEFISFADAAMVGLIDDMLPPDTLRQSATERIATLAALDRHAFSTIKNNRVEAIKNSYEQTGRAKDKIFIDCWFSEPTQQKLAEAARKF